MLITLHTLAKTYKMLPSEALSKGSTFDLYVMDTFHRYQLYLESKEKGGAPLAPRLSQEQMKSMIEKVRNKPRNKER